MKYRKYISILLAFVMIISLTACGGGDKEENTGGSASDGEGVQPSGSLSNTSNSTTDEDYSWWEGDWYGWWMIFDGDGYYADYINEAWDCCVRIEPLEGDHLISIWDEDMNSYEDNCLSEVLVEIDLEQNVATSVGDDRNYFWYGNVDSEDWVIDPEYAGYDNMLIIEGSYVDNEGEYCEYGVVLTKWGYEWNEDSTYAPDYYESYFLSRMNDGEPLPDIFEP